MEKRGIASDGYLIEEAASFLGVQEATLWVLLGLMPIDEPVIVKPEFMLPLAVAIETIKSWPTEEQISRVIGSAKFLDLIRRKGMKGFFLDGVIHYDVDVLRKYRREKRKEERAKQKVIAQQEKRKRLTVKSDHQIRIPEIPADLISISESAKLLGQKLATVWKWFVTLGLVPAYHDSLSKVSSNQVSRAAVMGFRQKHAAFFEASEKGIFSFLEFGQIISPGDPISRQTIAKWVKRGKLTKVESPTNQPFIAHDQINAGMQLVKKARQFTFRTKKP